MDFVSDFSGLFDFGDEPFSIGDLYKDHVFSQEFLDFTLRGAMIPPVEVGTSEILMPEMDISEMFAKDIPDLVPVASSPLQQSQGATAAHRSQSLHAHDGSADSPIDVETIEDDGHAQILSSPSLFPQAKTCRRVMDPAVVVLEAVTKSLANQSGWTVSEEISVTKLLLKLIRNDQKNPWVYLLIMRFLQPLKMIAMSR